MSHSGSAFAPLDSRYLGFNRGLDALRRALPADDAKDVGTIDVADARDARTKAVVLQGLEKFGPARATVACSVGAFHTNSVITPAVNDVKRNFCGIRVSKPGWAVQIENTRKRLHLSQAKMGELCGFSVMSVNRWERGENRPPAEALLKLGELAGDPDCWELWEYAGLSRSAIARAMPELEQRLHTRGEAKFDLLPAPGSTRETAGGVRLKKRPDAVAVPLLTDSAAAGSPRLVEQASVERIVIADGRDVPHPLYTTCIRIRGRSMYPILDDGYIVAVDTYIADPDRLIERMVCARDPEGGITIKWLRRLGQDYILVPQHTAPEFPIVSLTSEPGWAVVGEVIWWIGTPPK